MAVSEGGEAVVTCHTCGNHTHTGCFDRWRQQKQTQRVAVTCVWCRSNWEEARVAPKVAAKGPDAAAAVAAGAHVVAGGFGRYVNLLGDAEGDTPSRSDLYGGYWGG